MEKEDVAKWLVELHSNYVYLADRYGQTPIEEYAQAVARAIIAMAERM